MLNLVRYLTNKTNNMIRTAFGIEFEQSKKDGYINVTQLLNNQAQLFENFNEVRTPESRCSKNQFQIKHLDHYWNNEETKELRRYLEESEGTPIDAQKRKATEEQLKFRDKIQTTIKP